MIQKELNAVQAFHEAFKIGCAEQPTVAIPEKIKLVEVSINGRGKSRIFRGC